MKDLKYSEPQAKHELDFLTQYLQKGYSTNFHIKNNQLIAGDEGLTFSPEQISIIAEHRFEGMSNPSDQSLLYVIEAEGDVKGTIINGYGPSANLEIHEFMEAVPSKNRSFYKRITNLK